MISRRCAVEVIMSLISISNLDIERHDVLYLKFAILESIVVNSCGRI